MTSNREYKGKYSLLRGKHYVELDYKAPIQDMSESGVKDAWKVQVAVEYTIPDDGT